MASAPLILQIIEMTEIRKERLSLEHSLPKLVHGIDKGEARIRILSNIIP